jgi:hypothetical protein
MTINTLYISHQHFDWNTYSGDAGVFADNKTIKKFLKDSSSHDCYTTLEDLNGELYEIVELINAASNICLVDLDENFTDVVADTSLFIYLNFFKELKKVSDKDKVKNFDWYGKINKNLFNQLMDCRQTDNKTLWITGCSVTHGVGVDSDQRYAALLSEKLNLPTVFLSKPSTIAWQADQLLQSDIRAGDTVVWGLTSFNRVNYAVGHKWENCGILGYLNLPKSKQFWSIDYFNSATQSIPCIKNILQVMNFCKKVGATLYLINLLEPTWTDFIFSQEENYLDLTPPFNSDGYHQFLDFGTDKLHPGPIQHQEYATKIYNFIKEK